MIGDNINIRPEYFKNAQLLFDLMPVSYWRKFKKTIAVGGESGSGKSVTALCLQKLFLENNINTIVIHQDDYFKLPPKTNHQERLTDINKVGQQEVNLDLMQEHINGFKLNKNEIIKPLVDYNTNTIGSETIPSKEATLLIIECTYSLSLKNIDFCIFMDRVYTETVMQRANRNRDEQSEFIEQVLEIEHQIIRPLRKRANAVVLKDYSVQSLFKSL
jgi:uridine kinase